MKKNVIKKLMFLSVVFGVIMVSMFKVVGVEAASGEREAIVTEAKKHLGKPYTQDTNRRRGPNAFDCSGLTYYVFNKVKGGDIGVNTIAQERSGTIISVSQAKPGDLYFFGSRGNTSHVAIAIGDGYFIHSPTYGDVVKITHITQFPPSFALRMNLKDAPTVYPPMDYGKNITITKKGYPILGKLDGSVKNGTTDSYYGWGLYAKYHYNVEGKKYLSIFRQDKWIGFIEATATRDLVGVATNKVVKITKKGYPISGNFDWSVNKGNTDNVYGQIYDVKKYFDLGDGKRFYSLFSNGIWMGFVNSAAVSDYIPEPNEIDMLVSVSKKNYTVWGNLNWSSKKGMTDDMYSKTYTAKKSYNMNDGKVFYSLFSKGEWIGFLNSEAVVEIKAVPFTKDVRVIKKDWTIWGNMDFSVKKGSTTPYYDQVVRTKYIYTIGNGNTYYSIFDKDNNWIGFLNTDGTIII